MCENNSTFVLYVVELCSYIIPNVSYNVQTRGIHPYPQGDGAFHLFSCAYNFQERVRE